MLLCESCGANKEAVVCCGIGWCEDCWADYDIMKHDFPIVPEDES